MLSRRAACIGREFWRDDLPLLLAGMCPDVGLGNRYEFERRDPHHRIWLGQAYRLLASALFRIRDIGCAYRLIGSDLLDLVRRTSTGAAVCVELVRKLEVSGCQACEVGVHHYSRQHGRWQLFLVRSPTASFAQLALLYLAWCSCRR